MATCKIPEFTPASGTVDARVSALERALSVLTREHELRSSGINLIARRVGISYKADVSTRCSNCLSRSFKVVSDVLFTKWYVVEGENITRNFSSDRVGGELARNEPHFFYNVK